MFVVGAGLFVVGAGLFVVGTGLFVVGTRLFVVGAWLFVVSTWLFVVDAWLFVILAVDEHREVSGDAAGRRHMIALRRIAGETDGDRSGDTRDQEDVYMLHVASETTPRRTNLRFADAHAFLPAIQVVYAAYDAELGSQVCSQ